LRIAGNVISSNTRVNVSSFSSNAGAITLSSGGGGYQNKFWNGANIIWENLKEGVLDFENYEAKIHYQNLHAKISYVIIYVISYKKLYEICTYISNLYNIEPRIIFKTHIHMQDPSCSTFTLILILKT
jgi:hypothetical protein